VLVNRSKAKESETLVRGVDFAQLGSTLREEAEKKTMLLKSSKDVRIVLARRKTLSQGSIDEVTARRLAVVRMLQPQGHSCGLSNSELGRFNAPEAEYRRRNCTCRESHTKCGIRRTAPTFNFYNDPPCHVGATLKSIRSSPEGSLYGTTSYIPDDTRDYIAGNGAIYAYEMFDCSTPLRSSSV
jgi:hypothetical protein